MSLHDEIRDLLDISAKSQPVALRALTEGPQEVSDSDMIAFLTVQYTATREALLKIAQAIDSG